MISNPEQAFADAPSLQAESLDLSPGDEVHSSDRLALLVVTPKQQAA